MTTDSTVRTIAIVIAVLVASALPSACGSGAGLDRATLPRRMQQPYRQFEARCSRCHSISRPLTADVSTVEHWERYIQRMRHMPGSGISERDGRVILQFLAYYTLVIRGGAEDDDPRLAATFGGEDEGRGR